MEKLVDVSPDKPATTEVRSAAVNLHEIGIRIVFGVRADSAKAAKVRPMRSEVGVLS